MAVNASVITNVSKDITQRTVVDYGAGVFAHTTKDWGRHNVVRSFIRISYTSGGAEVSNSTLRLVATLDDGSTYGSDIALAVPANLPGQTVATNSAPIIIQQPASVTVAPASLVQISVAAISDIAVTFQWQKLSGDSWENLSGKTATTLVLTGVTSADDGSYRVVVTNENGSVTSSTATLLVATGGEFVSEDSPLYESLPGVKLFKSLFG